MRGSQIKSLSRYSRPTVGARIVGLLSRPTVGALVVGLLLVL